jgi:DNA helicase IV
VERGRITAYEDEDLAGDTATTPAPDRTSPGGILAREIERPRVGPMRDIVATIQPEQDEIVRAGPEVSICVQGAPGTGKTAVGLHRAAWLLYAHRDRLSRSGVLVVGPNRSFLDHVGAVLPSLGEVQVAHTTVEDLVVPTGTRVGGQDATPVASLKGDERMAAVLHRAVWSHLREPVEALVLPRGSRRWRIPGHEAAAVVGELRGRGVRYSAARDMLAHRLAHALLVLMEEAGDSPDDRVQDAVARSREVRRYVDAVWPALEPRRVLWRLLTDREFLAACTDGVLDPDERDLLPWSRAPRSPGAARWSVHDAVLMDEVADLLSRTPSLGHVVLDEAQDLSPMQLRAVGRRCSTGATTVLGDIAQGTTAWATPSWEESLRHLGHPGAVVEVLDRGFRVPHAVITYAARLLPLIAPGMGAPTSVRDDPGSLELVHAAGTAALWAAVVTAVRSALAREGSVAVIVPDGWVERASRTLTAAQAPHEVLGGDDDTEGSVPARLVVVPATTAKGLEYDRVVVVEPAVIADDEPTERTGLRRLYVVLTRAVSALTVVHHRPLPGPLAEHG